MSQEGQPHRLFNPPTGGRQWLRAVYDGKEVSLPAMLSWLAPEFDAYLVIPSAEGDAR